MISLNERQNRLLEWLKGRPAVSLEEAQAFLGVSTPTVYRDARVLQQAGLARKNGQRLAYAPPDEEKSCLICHGDVNERSAFTLYLQDGSRRRACCPHCGLMALRRFEVASALTPDFLYGRMVNVKQAVFLLNCSVGLCCEPPALCFASREDALNFQKGFGGQVGSLEDALAWVHDAMQIG